MKRFLSVMLAVVVLFAAVLPKQTAHADALTATMVSSGVLAIAKASGLDFIFSGANGQSVQEVIQNRVNSFLAGRSLSEVFGDEVFRIVAGKLIIPAAAVTGITSLLLDLISKYNLQENASQSTVISLGLVNGQTVYPYSAASNPSAYPKTAFVDNGTPSVGISITSDSYTFSFYDLTGTKVGSSTATGSVSDPQGYFITTKSDGKGLMLWGYYRYRGTVSPRSQIISNADYPYDTYGLNCQIPGSYDPPENLNDLQSWEGTVSNAPDTNLDQLMEDIFDQSAAGTLDVSGEVVDTPADPVPTAAPGDVIGGLDTISGQLEGIDNTLTGVQEGVGEAVGQLEGINEGIGSISEALEVPSASEAPAFKFDLTTLFPFCIPFDIYRFVTMFSASPVAPHVQIPFNIPAINLQYTFDLDFSSFDGVASVLRSVELIAFCVGLAILTSKVIRW